MAPIVHFYGVHQAVRENHEDGRLPADSPIAINNFTIANIMKDWYIGFVLNLDPNSVSNSGTRKPQWPEYSPPGASDFTVMDVNYTMMGATPDPDVKPRCDFLHGQSYVVRN